MKVYTKKGDQGETSLFGGKRLPKNHYRIEAYGTLDELNSFIGAIRDTANDTNINADLIKIQEEIFTLGSWIASDPDKIDKLSLPNFEEKHVTWLEDKIDEMESNLPAMKNFILPGGHLSVSFCHLARCVCRKAERNLVTLHNQENVQPLHLKYINRLSDYLFVLSRKVSKQMDAVETPWKPF